MMKKRLLLTLTALALATASLMAVPAKPGVKKKVTLGNGQEVELELKGDEHYSFYVDTNGQPCRLQNGRLVSMTHQEVADTWTARRESRLNMANSSKRAAARRAGKPSTVTTGKQKGLVILMEYQDVKFVTPNPQQAFQRFFNEPGYHEGGMAGSVRDYFLRQSYDQLEINFDVVGPYTTKGVMEEYGRPTHYDDGTVKNHDVNAVGMVAEGVDAASKEVDFSAYDWDNDGEVDQVFVIYAGYAEAQGADENTVWPHEWKLEAKNQKRTYNGKVINTYGCTAELRGDGKTWGVGEMDGIGTACHEFSHCMGLPDMYDTNGQTAFGMSYWDVMDAGSYNDNSCTPAGYTSYERWFSGWMEPVEVNTMTRINDMKPLATNAEAYILYNDANKNEYYLLENRQPVGFDKGLPGHGLLVVHVDYEEGAWLSNVVNAVEAHQRMTIIPADNELKAASYSLASDPWPGRTGNTSLTNYTKPAASIYNKNTDGTFLLGKPIDNITENTETNTVSFVLCRPEMDIPQLEDPKEVEGTRNFTAAWSAVTGAISYEVELNAMEKPSEDPSKALIRTFDFEKCYSKSAGFTDISASLSNYGLSGWGGSNLYTTPNKLRFGTSKKNGSLKSPTWSVPSTADITIVLGVDKVSADVTATLTLTYGNSGDKINECPTQTASFTVTGNNKIVISFKDVRKDYFWFEIVPNAQMYLNYLAIYNGVWTAEQLGIETAAAPRRAATIETFRTNTNSYTFTNMDTTKRFIYRVRALGEENTFSQWSDEKTFQFSSSAPDYIVGDANGDGVVDVADVVAIVNKILEKPAEDFNEKAADVNGDGVIDVGDVVSVVNLILR